MARKPGVLLNANARGVRRDPELPRRIGRHVPPERVRSTSKPEDVVPAVEALLAEDVDALVLVGGDGTVGGTLTPLLRRLDPSALPPLVATRGGTVNTVASSLGARGRADDTLAALLASASLREERRPVLRVEADGGEPAYGMIFVNGVGVRFLELYYAQPRLGPASALAVVTRIATSALVGGELARRVFTPFEAEVVVDGEHIDERRFTVMAASGVRDIGLGFAPFHHAGRDPGRIHFAVTAASAPRLALELPALRLGGRGSCLHHFAAGRAEVRLAEPGVWSLDADAFPRARHLAISTGPALRFLRPS